MSDFAVIGTIVVSVVCGSIFLFVAYREFWSGRKPNNNPVSDIEKLNEDVSKTENEPVHA